MRQWLVKPNLMCQRHLLGEHVEHHMFQGSMRGNIRLDGYYEKHLFFGPKFLLHRHSELVPFILGHKTEITEYTIKLATDPWDKPFKMYSRLEYQDVKITKEMVKTSRTDLVSRCGVCRSMHLKAKREGENHRYLVPAQFSSSGGG